LIPTTRAERKACYFNGCQVWFAPKKSTRAGGPWNYKYFIESDLAFPAKAAHRIDIAKEDEPSVRWTLPISAMITANSKTKDESSFSPSLLNFEFSMTMKATQKLDDFLEDFYEMEVVLVHQTTKVRQDDYESKRSAKKSRFD
jgi:hypothetical protein